MIATLKNKISSILTFLHNCERKKAEFYIFGYVLIIALITGSWLFYVSYTCNNLAQNINKMYQNRIKISSLKDRFTTVEKESVKITEILDQGITIKGFLLSFGKKLGIDFISDYEDVTTDFEDNDLFNEISLSASLQNISMQKLVSILENLQAIPEIYVRELNLKKSESGLIDVTFLFATLRSKTVFEGQNP